MSSHTELSFGDVDNRKKFFDYYIYSYLDIKMKKYEIAGTKCQKANSIIYFYIFDTYGTLKEPIIKDMTHQEIYDVAMELYCEAISMGDKNAKTELAEHLLKKDNPYLTYDKQLGEFLIQVGLLEKQLGSCIFLSENWEIEPNENIINFWSNLFNKWLAEENKKLDKSIRPKLGIKLDLKYDKKNRRIIFTCPDNQDDEQSR